MESPIKWAMEITQRSKDYADKWDTPIAVTINMSFGVFTSIGLFLSLLSGLLWLMADMSGAIYSLRIFLIITIASAITWVLALKAVEIYLNFVDDEGMI